jgi:hypothetical protein
MICQFQKHHELDYASKTAVVLKQVADMRKAMNEKNASTSLDNTADDIQEARDDNGCDDAEEEDDNEDEEHGEGRAAPGVQRKRRQERSFYFTTDQISTQKRQGGP